MVRKIALTAAAVAVALAAIFVVRALDRFADGPTEFVRTSTVANQPAAAAGGPDRGPRSVTTRAVRIQSARAAATTAPQKPATKEATVPDAEEARPDLDARDYIAALRASGETEGLAAFPSPGIRPPKPGVIVPDDYELPEGFMRHYQSTDDGGQLAPILTLAPGYELVDENGKPIPLPKDRIVPPELAPPDLPVRILEVPSTADRADDRR